MALKMLKVATLLVGLISAANHGIVLGKSVGTDDASSVHRNYIVELDDPPLVAFPDTAPVKGKKLDLGDPRVVEYSAYLETKQNEAAAAIGVRKIWSYKYGFNGFLVRLTDEEANKLMKEQNVLSVQKDETRKIQTENTAAFLGLSGDGGPWSLGFTGEDVVIGVIDSGINPEHPSFADIETPMNGNTGQNTLYGPPPAGFNGKACDFGNAAFNPQDLPANCSNKLLTAKCFATSYSNEIDADLPCGGDGARLFNEFLSARDASDHGSHVASTAAGNYGVEASDAGQVLGNITGMAPRARLAVYKVCWDSVGCGLSDIVAAIDQAIADGVDVINYSLGSPPDSLPLVADEVAMLRASAAGIHVAAAAGNEGPSSSTMSGVASLPWVTSVGASTDDSVESLVLQVVTPADIARNYVGLPSSGGVAFEDVDGTVSWDIVPAEPADACSEVQNDLTGKIALVIRGTCFFTDKFNNVTAAGAKAVVVYNDGTASDRMDPFIMSVPDTTIPGFMISYQDGNLLNSASNRGETVSGAVEPVPAGDQLAGFSSRGPGKYNDIIKPDVVAPGVSILAAGDEDEEFLVIEGTSMASPHVAGVYALLKQAHPEWSPAAAKSALMTTARQGITQFDGTNADPLDIGSGHIMPSSAFDPGLVYDADVQDYEAFSCDKNLGIIAPERCDELDSLGVSLDASDLNYPSLAIGDLVGTQTVVRKVTSVARAVGDQTFSAVVEAPPGVQVTVNPSSLKLTPGESATYNVTFTVTGTAVPDEWAFGSITWSNKNNIGGGLRKDSNLAIYSVRSPVAVRPTLFDAPTTVSGSGKNGSETFDVNFGYTGSYSAKVHGLAKPVTQEATVESAWQAEYSFNNGAGVKRFRFRFLAGTLFASFATFNEYTSGNDDLDMWVHECRIANDMGGTETCSQIGFSTGPTSKERFDLPFPDDSAVYVVDIQGWLTEGFETNFTLFEWYVGVDDDRKNMVVQAPTSATAGEASITVSWPGADELEEGAKYLGLLSHTGQSGLIGGTVVEIET